jgi:predicted Zn-dependent peptidase
MGKIKKTKLANGLRVILINQPGAKSVSLGLYIKAGSRYEGSYPKGISHFLEHIVFEGTENYPEGVELTRLVQGHGGSYNARTDVDNTYYYCQLPKRNYNKGLTFLNELIFKPLLREKDVEDEKSVIIEEIKYKNDQPEIRSARNLFRMMGEGTSLSRSVAGTKESVESTGQADIKSYHQDFYTPSNMVFVAVGDFDQTKMLSEISNLFKAKGGQQPEFVEEFESGQKTPGVKLDSREIDQAQIFVGARGFGYDDPKRYPWIILTNILGRGFDSRLYQILRKEKGYSYAPEAACYSMKNIGFQIMGGGFKKDKAEESVKIILEELNKLKDKGITKEELSQAKKYLVGSIDLDQDDINDINEHFGSQALLYEKKLDFNQLKDKIRRVELEDVNEVIGEVYRNDNLNLSIVGPYEEEDKFKKIFRL